MDDNASYPSPSADMRTDGIPSEDSDGKHMIPPPPANTTADEPTAESSRSSLHYSLLGPSLLKAGQEGVDQTKISEIIYNASKGSKFFRHEKKRDEQVTTEHTCIVSRQK